MLSYKIFPRAAALLLCAAFLSGCGAKESSGGAAEASSPAPSAETSASITETSAEIQAAENDNSVDPTVKFDLDAGVTDKMYSRALLSEGNTARLAAAMKKAEKGEETTVAVIGGSITQGSLASSGDKCYASLFFSWWENNFPDAKINTVNAGIGGTDSYLGVHRADKQLLSFSPDVVIVEFSVNDTDKMMNKFSYDSLVRKILSAENDPAVILLFTTQENGTSLQSVHKEIGAAYDLPMISYREAVFPEVEAGTILWKDISPDNIHPNDKGHALIGQLLERYLDSVRNNLYNITEEPSAFTAEGFTGDHYKNAALYGADDISPVLSENFTEAQNPVYREFPDNWTTDGGGKLSFDVNCRNIGVLILRTTDGKSGTYEVFVDGERRGKLEADFSGGWGNYAHPVQVTLSKETSDHTIEIRPAEGEEKGITILALMLS